MSSDAQILAPPGAPGERADPRRWLTLVILLLAGFMNLLDVSIVNIAIPSIQRDLHASYADVQWALAGYTLAYALVLITGGRLGDTSAGNGCSLSAWPASRSCPRCAARPPARAC